MAAYSSVGDPAMTGMPRTLSKAEMLIDNWLYMAEIVHAYERKLPIEEDVYCDFYIPKGKVYIEYWGMTKFEGLEPISQHKEPREIYETATAKSQERLISGRSELKEGAIPKFRIEPYDDVVKMFIPKIEKLHGVKIDEEDVLKARRRLYSLFSPGVVVYAFLKLRTNDYIL